MTPDNPYGPFDAADGETICCPFCSEPDFDAIGLKHHFQSGHCDVWNETPPPPRSRMETAAVPCPDCGHYDKTHCLHEPGWKPL